MLLQMEIICKLTGHVNYLKILTSISLVMNKDHVIVEAKTEYTKELISLITEPVYDTLSNIFEQTEKDNKKRIDLIVEFQQNLRQIPVWNQDEINKQVEKITSKCSWVGDLLAAIFISNVKILTSVKIGKDKKKIQITMPKLDIFIHKVHKNAAKSAFDNPRVFLQQDKRAIVTELVQKSIEDTIRNMLPFENILQSYLGSTLNDQSDSESDDDDNVSIDNDNVDEPSDDDNVEPFVDSDDIDEQPPMQPEPSTSTHPEQLLPPAPPTTPAQPTSNGFFDNPAAPPSVAQQPAHEVRDVMINDAKFAAQQQQNIAETSQSPMFFPDAADDP